MTIKQTLATAGTVAVMSMSLAGSAFANYDGNHHQGNWSRHNWDHNLMSYASNQNQSANDYANYDSWWSARGNTWTSDRNLNTDWNDYVSWSEQNNKDWLTTRGKDWEYNDFQNWWNQHMNVDNNTNNDTCNH